MKVKEKHLKIKQKEFTENEFIINHIKSDFKYYVKGFAKKHDIRLKEFTDKFEEVFNVNDYKGKNEDEFLNIILDKIIKPVLKDNNIDLV